MNSKEGIKRSKEAFQRAWKKADIKRKIREKELEENPRIRVFPRDPLLKKEK